MCTYWYVSLLIQINTTVVKFSSSLVWFDLIFWWHFQQYFSYIMATSFIGGRSQSTQREPPTMGKQLVNFITCGCESSAPFFVIYKARRMKINVIIQKIKILVNVNCDLIMYGLEARAIVNKITIAVKCKQIKMSCWRGCENMQWILNLDFF